ncbi:hypothetical protein Back11_28970 [Paenibacillus baekrokdamisoli]|uniref:peptidylprolyl isomerase n=1 Tax=Paenibacillus baekrokdamisoli TaxID=1712516 RepID=A0A3G9ITH2_9BACL|nr:peptidyl-prolyl cis-trans isomerase [Paenibacillus baekrokdamisoli]MBB3071133.1 parvulin-like peptidyl-prolyl isomerase [Paenibacillus baekrokdamisoli]BBH21552.1 hypothetical protein Back11_28970 [Paenibacillus baekrokdamisoli]
MLRGNIKFNKIATKKHLIIGIGVIIAAAACWVSLMLIYPREQTDSPVATVNGEPISVYEFNQRMRMNRTRILLHFQTQYGAQETPEFWTSSFDGEVPLEMLKKEALDECIRIKLQQLLARDKGLVQDISYAAFLKQFNHENNRRKAAIKAKEVIYGPVQYSEETYFEYVFSNMQSQLKDKLKGKEIAYTSEDLRQYYEATKAKYAKEARITIEKIAVTYVDQDGKVMESRKKEAKLIMQKAKERLEKGESFGELAEAYNETDEEKKSHGAQIFDSSSARTDRKYYPELLKEVSKLGAGQTSGIIEIGNTLFIVKCVEKQNGGYETFNEAKEKVETDYVSSQYESLIDKMVKGANTFFKKSRIPPLTFALRV